MPISGSAPQRGARLWHRNRRPLGSAHLSNDKSASAAGYAVRSDADDDRRRWPPLPANGIRTNIQCHSSCCRTGCRHRVPMIAVAYSDSRCADWSATRPWNVPNCLRAADAARNSASVRRQTMVQGDRPSCRRWPSSLPPPEYGRPLAPNRGSAPATSSGRHRRPASRSAYRGCSTRHHSGAMARSFGRACVADEQ